MKAGGGPLHQCREISPERLRELFRKSEALTRDAAATGRRLGAVTADDLALRIGSPAQPPAPPPATAEVERLRTALGEAYRAMRMADDANWGEFCGCCDALLSLEAQDEECGPAHTATHLIHAWLEAYGDAARAALSGGTAPPDQQSPEEKPCPE